MAEAHSRQAGPGIYISFEGPAEKSIAVVFIGLIPFSAFPLFRFLLTRAMRICGFCLMPNLRQSAVSAVSLTAPSPAMQSGDSGRTIAIAWAVS